MDYRNRIAALLEEVLKSKADLMDPPQKEFGDYSFACFAIAKEKKRNPVDIAKELSEKVSKPAFVTKIEARGPYLNFFVDKKELAAGVISQVQKQKDAYG